MIEPVLAAFLAVALLGEHLRSAELIGCAAIIAAAALAALSELRATKCA
jgi:drug/metabolite transporter (DMT)-like permease